MTVTVHGSEICTVLLVHPSVPIDAKEDSATHAETGHGLALIH